MVIFLFEKAFIRMWKCRVKSGMLAIMYMCLGGRRGLEPLLDPECDTGPEAGVLMKLWTNFMTLSTLT
jgi:hypothetical protein